MVLSNHKDALRIMRCPIPLLLVVALLCPLVLATTSIAAAKKSKDATLLEVDVNLAPGKPLAYVDWDSDRL